MRDFDFSGKWLEVKDRAADLRDQVGDRMPGTCEFLSSVPRAVWIVLFVLFIGLPVLYYPVAAWLFYYRVDNDLTWTVPDEFVLEGGSKTVSTLAALMSREVVDNPWTPNDPFYVPSYILDNPQNFQTGMSDAAERVALALSDFIGRNRGSSAFNPDLVAARSGLNYDPKRWVMSSESSTLLTESAESMYGTAIEKLLKYNADLANPNVQVWYTLRADNLRDTLNLISSDLGSAATTLSDHVDNNSSAWFDTLADDKFYRVQGMLYVQYMILQALEEDFAEVIQTKKAGETWTKMMGYLREALEIDPLVISNGDEEALTAPNHLSNQSARMQLAARSLGEIRDILDR